MPLILSGNVASAAATTFDVANSCRFNDGDSASMTKSVSSTSQTTAGTISCWFKRGTFGADQRIFVNRVDSANYGGIKFKTDDTLEVVNVDSGAVTGKLVTNRKFRDPAAWYHFCVSINSSDGTAGNRMRLYVNGIEETSFSTDTNPSSGVTMEFFTDGTNKIGQFDSDEYLDGYLAEFVMIHGSQLAPTSFGEFDEDSPTIWKPKDVSGLSFGSKDYYLDFEDSGDLDDDESGQGNDFTASNLAAVDQATDSPTNNFCVMNPLDKYWGSWTLSNGNNTVSATNAAYVPIRATVGLTAGKWYWEVEFDAWSGTGQQALIGICATDRTGSASGNGLAEHAYDYAYLDYDGKIYGPSNANASYGNTYTTGDIIGVYLDLDNNKLYFGKNGTIQASGTGFSIVAAASTTLGCYFPAVSDWTSNGYATFKCNFGSGQFGDTALSSAVADANGFGQFEYDPSDGGGSSFDSAAKDFLAICSANLGSDGG